MPLIYIAGPYQLGDIALNVRNAVCAAEVVSSLGYTPVIPHLTHFWHMLFPHEREFWLEIDRALLHRCDALVRIPGPSEGADGEGKYAMNLNITVYYGVAKVPCDMCGEFITRHSIGCYNP